MKVQELRELLKIADRPLLEKAFVESYKQFSKHQKEDIDVIISDILSGKDLKKLKQECTIDFDPFEREIQIFLENAYAQNYFAPNRVIPKNQRPKWRFLVKNYIKELQKIPPEDKNHKRAVKLMTDIYAMLCKACCYYLFSTEDPFRSIGWEQPDLFDVLVKMSVEDGLTQEQIASLINLAADSGLSMEALHIQQELILISELRTDTARRMAVDLSQKLIEEKKSMLAKLQKDSSSRYHIEEVINELCGMVLILMNMLGETESGIACYFKNVQADMKTQRLYQALRTADFTDDDLLWIQIYEYARRKKINPDKSTQAEYEKRKQNCGNTAVQAN